MSTSDHTQAPAEAGCYRSPDTGVVLSTIANPDPAMRTRQEHVIDLPELCPASHNPGPGSFLRIRYRSRGRFLEVFSLHAYVCAFVGHTVVRDVEMLTQAVARDCMRALGTKVKVQGCFVLPSLNQTVRTCVTARPYAPSPGRGI